MASRQLDDGRSSDPERGYDQEDRKDRERREIESTREPDRGTERETEEHLGGAPRPAGEVRIDRKEDSDDRERKRGARPNREGRKDEGHEGCRRGGFPVIGPPPPAPHWPMDSRFC